MSIQFQDVTFTYPNTLNGVFNLNFTVASGELMAVIGASGSGKSTLLKLIAGIESPMSGKIFLDEKDITPLPVQKRKLGIVFQSYALFPHMTVIENVAYPLKVRKISVEKRRTMAEAALKRVGLDDLGQRYPKTLSGGQQQRVALARALVFQPRALLLDEPLSALDAGLRGEMRDEILRLQREQEITTIHITHDQEEALSMADRVFVLSISCNAWDELYPGEKALYDAASQEGMVVSFDTGPTWANWGVMFKRFKKRYPNVEMAYNDLGSGATVVALEKARKRPQADTAYYFAGSAVSVQGRYTRSKKKITFNAASN